MPFSVVQDHPYRYQSKDSMRLPISDYYTNQRPISYRLQVIADCYLNLDTLRFRGAYFLLDQ